MAPTLPRIENMALPAEVRQVTWGLILNVICFRSTNHSGVLGQEFRPIFKEGVALRSIFFMQMARKKCRNNSGIRFQAVLRQTNKRDESRLRPFSLPASTRQGLLFLQYTLLCMSLASLLHWFWFKAEISNDHSTSTTVFSFSCVCCLADFSREPHKYEWQAKEGRLKYSPFQLYCLSYILYLLIMKVILIPISWNFIFAM